ncbi:MAG: hypothetical protein Q9191_000001 [Dirinaria sp. TL-2023a]
MFSLVTLLVHLFLSLPSAWLVQASGFTTYRQLVEGANNDYNVAYQPLDRSDTLFVNVQILPNGSDHTCLWNDFTAMCNNHAGKNISVIPRMRYGKADGSITPEPDDANIIISDLNDWIGVLNSTSSIINIPIVQAGVLGQYGEWHHGPFCKDAGASSSSASLALKQKIVDGLLSTGVAQVALRNPRDHHVLAPNITAVTIHDDCIMAQGANGNDSGTFVEGDGQSWAYWKSYTQNVARINGGFGGEGCEDDPTNHNRYNWTDWATVCSTGSNGLITYINNMQISYLNCVKRRD